MGDNRFILSIHEPPPIEWLVAHMMVGGEAAGWIVHTHGLGHDPSHYTGYDYSRWANVALLDKDPDFIVITDYPQQDLELRTDKVKHALLFFVISIGLVLFTVIKKTIGLRVTAEEELKGLDIGEHGMEAYAGFQIFTTT